MTTPNPMTYCAAVGFSVVFMGFLDLSTVSVGMAVDGLGYQAADCSGSDGSFVAPAVPAWGGRTGKELDAWDITAQNSIGHLGTRAAFRCGPTLARMTERTALSTTRLLTLPLMPIRAHLRTGGLPTPYQKWGCRLRCASPTPSRSWS